MNSSITLVSKDSFKNLGCRTIHWTVSLEGFLMLFQVRPSLVVMSKQNFVVPSPGEWFSVYVFETKGLKFHSVFWVPEFYL